MTNAEKFSAELKQLINNKAKIAIVRGVPYNCNDVISCKECQRNCSDAYLVKWLISGYIIKLSKQEKEFLNAIRYPDGKTIKRYYSSLSLKYKNGDNIISIDESLFPFIKENEEWSVNKLLRLDTWED